jgi:hypothetical protein
MLITEEDVQNRKGLTINRRKKLSLCEEEYDDFYSSPNILLFSYLLLDYTL